MDEPTFSVGELNHAIAEALVDAFPRQIWVRGEIQQFHKSRNGHAYFELVEKDGGRDRVRAVLRVALFRGEVPGVNRALEEVPGVRLTDGVEVRIRGRVDFYPPVGRLQLVMNGIDPVFTVGRLAADRERVIRTLAGEGVLRANAALELAPVPLRIGLVTSGGSAAYHDFLEELGASGHAFRVAHVDVRVQGGAASRRIAFALRRLAQLELDAIVLVRGGGARSDLAAFDSEIVARAITEMPVPVLTGIGHEVDRTVADEVAHTCCKTPTAAAGVLVSHVDDFCARLARISHRVASRRGPGASSRPGSSRASPAVSNAPCRPRCSASRPPSTVTRGGPSTSGAGRLPTRPVRSTHTRRAITVGGARATRQAAAKVAERQERVETAARRGLRTADGRVTGAEARLRGLDPRRVLERGYTITRDSGGRVLTRAAALDAITDGTLVTEFADGTVTSRVEGPPRPGGASDHEPAVQPGLEEDP